MQTEREGRPATPPIVRKAVAGVVLIAAIALATKLIIGVVTAVFWTVVALAVAIAALWAVRTLAW